jgi:hypothetical protein
MLSMVDLGFDVILIVMDALSLRELSYVMRTCKMLHHTGMPLLVRMGASPRHYNEHLAFLHFLLIDPHIRVSYLRQFTINKFAWPKHLGVSQTIIDSSASKQILKALLEQMLTHASNLAVLTVIDRYGWFLSSVNIVDTVVASCRSINQLDISASLNWENAHLLVERLNCPLRSLRIRHSAPTSSPNGEPTVPLDILSPFKDTLEELEIIGARLVIGVAKGEGSTWPQVHFLKIHVHQDEALLARSFPNTRSLYVYETGKPDTVVWSSANASTWRNLDMAFVPTATFVPFPKCRTRLLSTELPHFGFPIERYQNMLKTRNPSVLDLALAPFSSLDVIKAALTAVPHLRCLRLSSTMEAQDSEAMPLMVHSDFDSY